MVARLGIFFRLFATLFSLSIAAAFAADNDVSPSEELDVLRGVAVNDNATYSDLCNVISIQTGDFAKYATAIERCESLTKQGVYNFGKIADVYSETVTAGAVAKAAINAHGLERSLLYFLTRFEWYAVQNAEALQLMPAKTNVGKSLSGEEMLAALEKAAALAGEKSRHGQTRNPYEQFGVKTYEELEKVYAEATDLKIDK